MMKVAVLNQAGVKKFSALLLSVMFVCWQTSALADDKIEISMQSAILFALEESPRIGISEEQKKQAEFSVDEAKSAYYPQVSLNTEIGREYNDPGIFRKGTLLTDKGNTTNASLVNLSLRQLIFNAPTFAEVSRREQLVNSADLSKIIEEQDVVTQTIKSYLSVYKYQRDVESSKEFLTSMESLVGRLGTAYEAGAESKSKMSYANARLTLAKSKLSAAESALNDALNKLQLYTGPLPEFDAVAPAELDLTEYDLPFYQKLAAEQNPDLALNESDIEAGKQDVRRQKAEYLPKVNFVVEGKQDENYGELRQREGRAVVQMQFDIFKGFYQKAATNKANSKVRELELQRQDILRDVKARIAQAYSEVLSERHNLDLKQEELDAYVSLHNVNIQALNKGDLDTFEVIENEERLHNSKMEMSEISTNLFVKSYELLRYIGALKKARFCESC